MKLLFMQFSVTITSSLLSSNIRASWDPIGVVSYCTNCLLEGLMMAVWETPKHVSFLINVNNKEFGCVRLSIVLRLDIATHTVAQWFPTGVPVPWGTANTS
jgi:hypothetical protein